MSPRPARGPPVAPSRSNRARVRREREINNLVRRANFNTDLYVKEFGLTISNNMMEVRGRVLPPPKLQYGGRVSSLGGQVMHSFPSLAANRLYSLRPRTAYNCVVCSMRAAGVAQPRRVGHARQAVLHGRRDPRVGHRVLRAAAHRARGRAQVSSRLLARPGPALCARS